MQRATFLPIGTGGPTKGIQIDSERPSEYNPFHQPKSFTYTPKRKLKRYTWYPWSLTYDPWTVLPGFDLDDIPGEYLHIFARRKDIRKPTHVCTYGHPKTF